MDAPKYQQPAPDPALAQLWMQSQAQDINALKTRATGDQASLMARFGTLAFGGSGAMAQTNTQPFVFDSASLLARYGGNLALAGTDTSLFRKA